MPHTVEVLPESSLIRVAFAGQVSLQDRAEALDAVLHDAVRSDCRRLLIDLSAATLAETSATETFAHATRLAREPLIRGMRIAYVGEASAAASVESLAALHGYFYQRFRSPASALRWLCGNGHGPRHGMPIGMARAGAPAADAAGGGSRRQDAAA